MPYRSPIPTPCADRHRVARAEVERAQRALQQATNLDEPWLLEAAERAFLEADREYREARVALFLSDEPSKPLCSVHATAPCLRVVDGDLVCRYEDSMPEGSTLVGPPSVLATPRDKHATYLVYRSPDGTETVVPNIHYNQPVAWRIEQMRLEAEHSRQRATSLRSQRGAEKYLSDQLEAHADRLDARAREMEASAV